MKKEKKKKMKKRTDKFFCAERKKAQSGKILCFI